MPNLLYLYAQGNDIHGFLPWGFNETTIPFFDFSDNELYCPLPKLPPGGRATCGSWSITSVDPDQCTLFDKCVVSVFGQGFVVGQKAFCVFGDITTVSATVVSDTEIHCTIIPSKAGKCDLSITVYGLSVTSNSVPFEFVASNKYISDGKKRGKKNVPIARRSGNADTVKVRIHGMSKNQELGTIMKFFTNIYKQLGSDVMDIDLGFVLRVYPFNPTGYWAPNGQSEVIGDGMIVCVKQLFGISAAMQFSTCLSDNADVVPSNAAACASTLGLDYSAIRQCVVSDDGKQLLNAAFALGMRDAVSWSPTVVINDKIFCLWGLSPCNATKELDFLRAVCLAYKGSVPYYCQQFHH